MAWVFAFSTNIPGISCNRDNLSKLDICMIGGSNDSTVFQPHLKSKAKWWLLGRFVQGKTKICRRPRFCIVKQWNKVVFKASVLGPGLFQILRPVTCASQHLLWLPWAPPPSSAPMLRPEYLGLPTPSSHSSALPAPRLMEDHENKAEGIREQPRVFSFFQVTVSSSGWTKALAASQKQLAAFSCRSTTSACSPIVWNRRARGLCSTKPGASI